MNKKVIKFSKLFLPLVIISVVILSFGIFGFFTKGLNLGLDFKAGLIQDIKIAPTALELTYIGAASVSIELSDIDLKVIISGVGEENETRTFMYGEYRTLGELTKELQTIDGLTAILKAPENTLSEGLLANSASSNVLSQITYRLHYNNPNADIISVEQIRDSLAEINDVSVKETGNANSNTFQIRVGDSGEDPEASQSIQNTIQTNLNVTFGKENTLVLKTDFIGAQFSTTLAVQAAILVLGTLLLILLYAIVRFKWDFALGAVLAIIHDALIMLTFIVWTRLEFNATMIAAILTIIGYSINDTVVVLDRVRENIPLLKSKQFTPILDISLTETLSRTIITTVTTLLAVVSLYVFTTGSMKDFALALIVGMISGVYSTIFITGAFIAFARRNWQPSDEERKSQTVAIEY